MAYGFKVDGVDVQDKFVTYEDVGGVGGYKVFARGTRANAGIILPISGVFPFVDGMTEISSLDNTKVISISYYAGSAIKTDGTLWAWGNNIYSGGVGFYVNGTQSLRKVNDDTDWAYVSTGASDSWTNMSAAIKTDGTLWTTGTNATGQLGLGDSVDRSSYTKVGTSTDWAKVATNGTATLAIKTDGTLWAWGNNGNGQLGLDIIPTVKISSPTQVGSLTDWVDIDISSSYNAVAIKTDGTLWTWGYNNGGQLGLGDVVSRSSPTQIGNLTNWKQVKTEGASVFAVKTNGTLWAWGNNYNGVLGLGNTTNRSSPVQVGSLSTWDKVCKSKSLLAIKADGTLWGAGPNTNYELSNALPAVTYSSPIQIGSKNDWIDATKYQAATFGLKNSI